MVLTRWFTVAGISKAENFNMLDYIPSTIVACVCVCVCVCVLEDSFRDKLKDSFRGILGGPVVRILSFPCLDQEFYSWSGN